MVNRMLMLLSVAAVLGCSTTDPVDGIDMVSRPFFFAWNSPARRSYSPSEYANVRNLLDEEKPMLALFREDLTHDAVVDYFVHLTGSPDIALPILYHADRENISVSLAFSLVWVESRFTPTAVNENSTSVDRGLFQLNSRTFADLSEEDFFHPDVNSQYGIEYLSWCIRYTPDEQSALVAYNAGLSRAVRGIVPQTTRAYIGQIFDYRRGIEDDFRRYILNIFPSQPV